MHWMYHKDAKSKIKHQGVKFKDNSTLDKYQAGKGRKEGRKEDGLDEPMKNGSLPCLFPHLTIQQKQSIWI